MFKRTSAWIAASAALGLVAQISCSDGQATDEFEDEFGDERADTATATRNFPSSTDVLPDGWTGPRFALSQSYPTKKPSISAAKLPWPAIDFRTDPDRYMFSIRDYFYKGLGVTTSTGAIVGTNGPEHFNDVGKKGFYSMPWLHTGSKRREGVHGLTRENDAPAGRFAPQQTTLVQNWGVAYYNKLGGYTIGRVWRGNKAADITEGRAIFPEGTAVIKMLWSGVTPEQMPGIAGAPLWDANINSIDDDDKSPRTIKPVRLLQMDVAVKDARAGVTGWVFGTFVYDKDADPAIAGGSSGWHKMMPIGVQWGNDPGVTAEMVAAGTRLRETLLSPRISHFAASNLGYAGRLNGPADKPESACMSCHSTSEYRSVSSMAPKPEDPNPMRYFRNLAPNEPFDSGRIALDYSQQMAIALRNLGIQGGSVKK